MADNTGIEWTDATWNPVAGCSDVSAGCTHCYARVLAGRLEAMGSAKYKGLTVLQGSHRVWTGKISFDEAMLLQPLRWKRPRRIFVNSMSDLFHPNVTDEMRDRIFAVMALCPQHTFQVLTKRPERISDALSIAVTGDHAAGVFVRIAYASKTVLNEDDKRMSLPIDWPLPNVRLGVSVENQKAADERFDALCELGEAGWQTMVSFEPLLSQVETPQRWRDLGSRTWAIAGGESGPHARPMHPDWARSLRDQCTAAGVPFFFKQWGEWAPSDDTASIRPEWSYIDHFGEKNVTALANPIAPGKALMRRVGKKAAGHLLDGVEHHAFPANVSKK